MYACPRRHVGTAGAAVTGTLLLLTTLAPGTAGATDPAPVTGLDATDMAGMLQDHFRIEHRVELAPITGIDTTVLAGMLQDHFRIEHRSDL